MDNGGNGLGKLLPKALSAKRRRRKQKTSRESDDDSSRGHTLSHRASTLGSEDTASSLTTGDEQDHDDRSFGSFESGADPEQEASLSRPGTISSHPSLIGYLTTSSPVVQATHLDSVSSLISPTPSLSKIDSGTVSRGRSPGPAAGFDSASHSTTKIHTVATDGSASPSRRSKLLHSFGQNPPRTPPNPSESTPSIVSTPPSPTDPLRSLSESFTGLKTAKSQSSSVANGNSPEKTMSTHRRSKSGSINLGPSRLSSVTTAPLSPTIETDEPTPSASTNTGFFSSMLSAAQTAANNLTNNIQSSNIGIGGNRPRPTSAKSSASTPPNPVEIEPAVEASSADPMEETDSAVQTLGAGDLSLSHLGIADPVSTLASPTSLKFPDVGDTRARSESAPVDALGSNVEVAPGESVSRPRSLQEVNVNDNAPAVADFSDKSGMHRASSIRSAIKPHRKRGSSVTASIAGAATGGASPSLSQIAHPNANASTPKLTGFAIASKKRNRDFHTLFKSVPDDDYLIEDYSCALQREILAHGRLYVSEGHLCFSSNILGWTTTLVMSFDEIVSVEKRSTALVFKNGLMISTLHAKHIFASFTSRDATYDLIVNIWKLGHPTLTSTLNGVRLEGTGGDKTEKMDAEPSGPDTETQAGSDTEEDSESEDDDDFYDEEDDDVPETQPTDVGGMDGETDKATRKASGMTISNGGTVDQSKEASAAQSGATDFPGPATHAPTDCGDSATHLEKFIGDDTIPAPLGKVYSLVFGSASPAWMAKWLTGDQKCTDLQMEDKKGLSLENRTRTFTYTKPLYAPIGPKQTKCIVAETVDSLDFDKAVNLSLSTQTPDVPSGNVFSVKTKYCLSWAENNATRVQVNCTIEWTGKSWLKGPIEKGCIDGQSQYVKDLFSALKASVSAPARTAAAANGAPRTKKKGRKAKAAQTTASVAQNNGKAKDQTQKSWGVMEPARGLLEPFTDALRPLLTGNIMYGILVGLLVATWFGFGLSPRTAAPFDDVSMYNPDRVMVYDAMWRREESELLDWLEERVGLDRLNADHPIGQRRVIEPRTLKERLVEENIKEKQVEEAIKVTEEKLKVLKEVVGKTKRKQGASKA
ncbi:hypothetical protein S7711_00835 [Stachybotrys chartarum IBT 7711]|uniref:VASt domain-containing protein n=1 Tax=Stachybotrys chartarum (strain CBS 109288 / IBT 7711) TaxID=1280523 RepID=A0A084B0C0_STACB|nr:hypothetical protein S7711_00835 [Stachybotrys chartarum IBT 7711]KFA46412.1 hypothetical protein S40293_07981 [Stachybotrys chartarum IBT 40293]KFA74276.1 hypothetical protein S40288_08462 [Stachybotrys chartarum IBT 40288]